MNTAVVWLIKGALIWLAVDFALLVWWCLKHPGCDEDDDWDQPECCDLHIWEREMRP